MEKLNLQGEMQNIIFFLEKIQEKVEKQDLEIKKIRETIKDINYKINNALFLNVDDGK